MADHGNGLTTGFVWEEIPLAELLADPALTEPEEDKPEEITIVNPALSKMQGIKGAPVFTKVTDA